MSAHTLPLPAYYARYRLGTMLGKVRRRLHHRLPTAVKVVSDIPWLPESENSYLLRQVFAQARRAQAQTLGELKSLLPMLENESAVAAATLYTLLGRLEANHPESHGWPLNQQSLDALLGLLPADQLDQLMAYASRLETSSRPCLYAEGRASIRPDALCAGLAGNSYFLAALIACSGSPGGPEAIWNMIRPNHDRSIFSIRFPGQAPVVTAAPTPSEALLYANAGSHGYWPALLVKAAACLCSFSQHDADNGPAPLIYTALEMLGGQPPEILDTSLTPQNVLRTKVIDALESGHLLIAAGNLYPWLEPAGKTGQLPGEAYALIRYDAEDDCLLLRQALGQEVPQDAEGQHLPHREEQILSVPVPLFATYFSHLGMVGRA